MFDGEAFGQRMVGIVSAYVEKATAPLIVRISELEEIVNALKSAEAPAPVDAEALLAAAKAHAEELVQNLEQPAPLDGDALLVSAKAYADELFQNIELPEPVDAQALLGEAKTHAEELVQNLELPVAVKGDDGKSVDMDELGSMVEEAVKLAVQNINLPNPEKGADGRGISDALINQDGHLLLTMTDGTNKDVGKVVGRDGETPTSIVATEISPNGSLLLRMSDGSQNDLGRVVGEDGHTFTLDDFNVEVDDNHTFTLSFQSGEKAHKFQIELPIPQYRGVFKETNSYKRGDIVTWGGSAWHCDEAKGARPAEADSGWTLMVKAGRNAKGDR